MAANPPIFLAGATASGKSSVALELAERMGGEIVSVDSMQVYRGMDIGTAKATPEEQARVPHHLIDILEVTAPFDAARFVDLAGKAASEIRDRGRVPIFCGGTGLYFKAYLEGLGESPSPDPALRARLDASPIEELLGELKLEDPETYDKIDRQNPRRVVRAVEVIRLTGRPFSQQRSEWSSVPAPGLFCLSRDDGDLNRRIANRVRRMFELGLVAETRCLLEAGLERNPTAMQAIGYRQVVEHLRTGRSLDETRELAIVRTRQFAKRQRTWFRNLMDPQWIEVTADQTPAATADQILSRLKDSVL